MSEVMAMKESESNGHSKQDVEIFDNNLEVVIQRAEKKVQLLKRVLGIAVKRTTSADWVDQQGKPYLTSSGAEKIAPVFGISIIEPRYEKNYYNDDQGQYYVYHYKATFSWEGGRIDAIGACSSRDKFFAWESKEKVWKPLSQVDDTNIMKASYSNMIVNGVTRLLGIRNLTWEELKEFGVSPEKVAKVSYGGKPATEEETQRQNEIGRWLLEMHYNNKDEAVKALEEATAFVAKDGKEVKGVTNVRKLTGPRLNIAHNKVQKYYQEWQNAQQAVDNA